MKKLSFFFTGMMLFLFLQQAQAQFKRHYWLDSLSVNYTLSHPTTNGEWMLAAAKQEPNSQFKNAIAVFRLDNNYAIWGSKVIGRRLVGEEFDPNVNFEIHCIVQTFNPAEHYVICGSVKRAPTAQTEGFIVVLDAGLNPQPMRNYPDVRNFYSVYAQDGYFYACGQMQNGRGVVLQDQVANLFPNALVWATTPEQQRWDYQKIRVMTNPGSGQIKVSGQGFRNPDIPLEIGYTIFNVGANGFSPAPNPVAPSSWRWQLPVNVINSKAVIANHPGGNGGQGVVESVSDANYIYTYMFPQQPSPGFAFRIRCTGGILEDVECAGTPVSQIAWVGNFPQRTAYYLHTNLNSSFPIPPATFTYFYPFPKMDNAYYSLHKLYFNRNQLEFHCGGYYKHNDGNKATFVVTPDLLIEGENECIKREEVGIEDLPIPDLHPLYLMQMEVKVMFWESLSREYDLKDMDCYEETEKDCGNQIIK
jgi:hypothetical protein